MSSPLVSIIIPTYNRKMMVNRLISSIYKSSYKNLEVIVVNDNSSDGTEKFIKSKFGKRKNFKLLTNKSNLYTAGSRNKGASYARGEFIFFIDDDNVLDEKAIKYLVETMISDVSIGEVGPVNYNFNSKKKILWVITRRNMFTTKTYQPRSLKEFKGKKVWDTVDIPNAFMVRTSVIKKNKIKFKPNFEIMYEESDFAYRIRNFGYSVKVVRNAKIYHDIENRKKGERPKDYMYHFMENPRRPYLTARNRILFHKLYSNPYQLIFILLFWIWLFNAYYIYKIMFYSGIGNFGMNKKISQSVSYLRGTLDGLFYLLNN